MAIHFNLSELMIASQDSVPASLLPLDMQLDTFESEALCQRLRDLSDKQARAGGIDFLSIYCSQTGAPIGYIGYDHVVTQMAQSFVNEKIDDEEMADDLTIRCLAAMRPSPLWVSVTPQRLEKLAFIDPVGVGVYLIMRAFDSEVREHRMPNGRKWSSLESMTHLQRKRIELHRALSGLKLDSLRDMLLALLQVDARVGLANLRAPELLFDADAIRNLDWFIREIQTPATHRSFVASVIRIYQAELDSYYQDALKAEKTARGNVVTRGMYEWFAKEHAPKSPTQLVAEVKRKKVKVTDSTILDELGDFDLDKLTGLNSELGARVLKPQPILNQPKPIARPSFAAIAMMGAIKIGVK